MKRNLSLFLFAILLTCGNLFAQKAWIDPAVIVNVDDSVTIYVDITQCDCQRLLGTTDPVYIWTWMPNDPVDGNGDWNNSNENNRMTNEGGDVWSITIQPSSFYGLTDPQPFYDNGISLLAKLKDGTGIGSGCDEDKTEDLMISVDAPFVPQQKVYSFPRADGTDSLLSRPSDVFTLFYDNSIEDKATMQNQTDLYVYARCSTSIGTEEKVAVISQVGNTPELQMEYKGDGQFEYMIIPDRLFTIPPGSYITSMRFQITKPVIANTNDAVDGEFKFGFKCE